MILHGILQIIVFTILFPSVIATALLRKRIGDKWKQYHVSLAILTIIMFTIAVTLGISKANMRHITLHKIIGLSLIFLIAFQIVWAYLGKKVVSKHKWFKIHKYGAFIIVAAGVINIILAQSNFGASTKAFSPFNG